MNARTTIPAFVLLSVLVGGVALAGGVAAGASTAQSTNATADVAVDDQVGTESVTVASATLSEGGFLAVYNASGGLIGHSAYLDSGDHENVTIELSPALSRSQVVIVEAHTDDGDEAFNASADAAYTTADGQVVADTAYVATEEFTRSTATETATETTTETTTETATAAETTETSGPGFTALAALVALVGAALLARR